MFAPPGNQNINANYDSYACQCGDTIRHIDRHVLYTCDIDKDLCDLCDLMTDIALTKGSTLQEEFKNNVQ